MSGLFPIFVFVVIGVVIGFAFGRPQQPRTIVVQIPEEPRDEGIGLGDFLLFVAAAIMFLLIATGGVWAL